MTLLASGTYRYRLDGALQPIEEPWTFHRIDHRMRLHGQRVIDGNPLLEVDADYDGSICKAMHVRWQAAPPQEIRYWHVGEHFEWQRKGEPGAQFIDVPPDSLMFPLLRAATGLLLPQLIRPRAVIVPSFGVWDVELEKLQVTPGWPA